MIANCFKFRSVGQGLFYTGTINIDGKNFNFVYDCGTVTDQKLLYKQIDNFINEITTSDEKPVIDFVVISHLHLDHYSGLYYLSNKATIKKIYIPFIDKEIVDFSLVYDFYIRDNDIDDNELGQVFNFVRELLLTENDTVTFINDQTNNIEIPSSIKIWIFKLLHKKFPKILKDDIINDINSLFDTEPSFTQQDLIAYITKSKDNSNNISKIYLKYLKNKLNNTSIILVHFPAKVNSCCVLYKYYFRNLIYRRCAFSFSVKTLLTGDIDFTTNILNKIVKRAEPSNYLFLCLQVPHHGAKSSWAYFKKTGIIALFNVISFGYGNRYCHPSNSVLKDLSYKSVFLVTQIQMFEYRILLYF